MDLSASIRVGLAYRGKNQTWLANEMGVHRSYINQMAKGKVSPGLKQAGKIAEILGYSLSEFIALGEVE